MSEILRRYFWTAYDHLGGVVAYNLLWSLLSLPWIGAAYMLLRFGFSLGGLFLPGAVVLAGVLLFGSPATVLLFIVCANWARRDELNLRELLLTGRRFFLACNGFGRIADRRYGSNTDQYGFLPTLGWLVGRSVERLDDLVAAAGRDYGSLSLSRVGHTRRVGLGYAAAEPVTRGR